MVSLLERHQLDFETHEAITHVIPRVFGEALEVWRVPVASLGVPHPVQVPSDLVGHAAAREFQHLAPREEHTLQALGIVSREDPVGPSCPTSRAARTGMPFGPRELR